MRNNGRFASKVVLVTGGAQGIGAATASAFAHAGARVVIGDIDARAGARRARDMAAAGADALFVKADMAGKADVARLVRAAVRRFGGLDVLVNNVGIGSPTRFASRPTHEWDRVIDTNLRGAYLAIQCAAAHLARASGSIVNISSTRALMSEPDTEPYSASKGGILALTHSLAVTLSGRVRVNAVSPGWIDTSAWHYGSRPARLTRADHRQHPAGRVGKPEDIASACLFLCSAEAGFITGVNLVVDGGMTVKMIYEP